MGRFREVFDGCRARGERALMPYLTAGDPNLAVTRELLPALGRSGADIIEVGIPFSDPLLDGPVIQEAGNRALAAGVTPHGVMQTLAEVRPRVDAAILYMTPYNLIWRYGVEQFVRDTASAGVDGVLITDLPPEESDTWQQLADDAGLETIYLLAPTSSPARIRAAAARATGFLYYISRRGVTGEQSTVPVELNAMLAAIRAETDLPVAVGFGISTAAQVAEVVRAADGAVVGSALVSRLAAVESTTEKILVAESFCRELKQGTLRS